MFSTLVVNTATVRPQTAGTPSQTKADAPGFRPASAGSHPSTASHTAGSQHKLNNKRRSGDPSENLIFRSIDDEVT
jgi:hypothetical protein